METVSRLHSDQQKPVWKADIDQQTGLTGCEIQGRFQVLSCNFKDINSAISFTRFASGENQGSVFV